MAPRRDFRSFSGRNSRERRTRVAILGDSYCHHLKNDLARERLDGDLNLRRCRVSWFANRGGTARKALRFDLAAVENARPDVCIVQLGGNELDKGEKPGWVVATLCLLAVELKRLGAKVVYICEVTPRLSPKFSSHAAFTQAARECNKDLAMLLGGKLREYPRIFQWKMKKLCHSRRSIHAEDGVHLNDRGQRRLFHNLRMAAMAGDRFTR